MAFSCSICMLSGCHAAEGGTDAQRAPRLWLPAPSWMPGKLTAPRRQLALAMQPRQDSQSRAASATCHSAVSTAPQHTELDSALFHGSRERMRSESRATEHQAQRESRSSTVTDHGPQKLPVSAPKSKGVRRQPKRRLSQAHHAGRPARQRPKGPQQTAVVASGSGRQSSDVAHAPPTDLDARLHHMLTRFAAVPERLDRNDQIADSAPLHTACKVIYCAACCHTRTICSPYVPVVWSALPLMSLPCCCPSMLGDC